MNKVPPTAHMRLVELEDKLNMFRSFVISLLPIVLAHMFLVQVLENAEPSAHRRPNQ